MANLDHLLVCDAKHLATEQSRHDSMLRVRVDACSSVPQRVGIQEEGRAYDPGVFGTVRPEG